MPTVRHRVHATHTQRLTDPAPLRVSVAQYTPLLTAVLAADCVPSVGSGVASAPAADAFPLSRYLATIQPSWPQGRTDDRLITLMATSTVPSTALLSMLDHTVAQVVRPSGSMPAMDTWDRERATLLETWRATIASGLARSTALAPTPPLAAVRVVAAILARADHNILDEWWRACAPAIASAQRATAPGTAPEELQAAVLRARAQLARTAAASTPDATLLTAVDALLLATLLRAAGLADLEDVMSQPPSSDGTAPGGLRLLERLASQPGAARWERMLSAVVAQPAARVRQRLPLHDVAALHWLDMTTRPLGARLWAHLEPQAGSPAARSASAADPQIPLDFPVSRDDRPEAPRATPRCPARRTAQPKAGSGSVVAM